MKTMQDYQAVVDEIRAVCAKHGVVMFGTSWGDSTLGEIAIADASGKDCSWNILGSDLTNKAQIDHSKRGFMVLGIGDLAESVKS
jgi:hypothetical protein